MVDAPPLTVRLQPVSMREVQKQLGACNEEVVVPCRADVSDSGKTASDKRLHLGAPTGSIR